MNFFKFRQLKKEIAPVLIEGGIGVLPTDTLYGIVGSALNKETVEKIYKLRKRNFKKPMIILISSMRDLEIFGIEPSKLQKKVLKKIWPGKITVVLQNECEEFSYLDRGEKTLALRVPDEKWLREFLKLTGPLVAPSANFEGMPPACTKEDAKKYFGNEIDFYVDLDTLSSEPSTIIRLGNEGEIDVLRDGAVKI